MGYDNFFQCVLNDYYSTSSYLLNLHFKFYFLRIFIFFINTAHTTTGCPAAMTDNNDPDDTVMASVFPGDRPMSFVAEAPLTVIAPARYNNDTTTIAFAVATTTGTAAATHGAGAATLTASSEMVNAAQTHAAATAASEATLVAMTAASETENAPFDTAPLLNVATSSASFPPSTYFQNEEDFVASLLSSGAAGKNEDTTPAVGNKKAGVA